MIPFRQCLLGLLVAAHPLSAAPIASPVAAPVEMWMTTEDLRLHLTPQAAPTWQPGTSVPIGAAVIDVVPAQRFQTVTGWGASLEHSTCSNLFRLPAGQRDRALARLVDPEAGIGMNLMRVCIGTSDFSGEPWYSYDDLPSGGTDPDLGRFSVVRDRAYVLPVLRAARRLNPGLRFFASPWSPPGWMKTSGSMVGGELKREWYPAYAQYFVQFLRAYAEEGIPVDAVTVQNEPGVDRALEKDPKWHYPSCHWKAEQERDFIRDHLGPALKRAGLRTEIWCYDHNYNVEPKEGSAGLAYPRTILEDRRTAGWVGGVAFHHYEGDASGMTRFHEMFPDVPVHFSEGSVFTIWGGYDLVERWRNWAVSYNAWVSLLDEQGRPNLGPFPATSAILRLRSDTLAVEETFEFHNYGHFMKFLRRGAVRVASGPSDRGLADVAFVNPDGGRVVVLVNPGEGPQLVWVRCEGKAFPASLPGRAMATCRWR